MADALRSPQDAEPRESAKRGSASREPAKLDTTTRRKSAAAATESGGIDAAVVPLKDLPPAGTRHWVPRYKAAVVAAVDAGVLTLDDAQRRYMLSEEELECWRDTIDRYGVVGLRMSVSERRRAARLTVSEDGFVGLNAGERTHCLIANVSDQGARLEIDPKIALPHHFELGCERSGRSWWVDLVWQRGGSAGVRFSNPLSPPFMIRTGLGEWLAGRRDTVAIDRKD